MIRIQRRLFEELAKGGQLAVQEALQTALRLEHATIPPYLYALYSLDRAKNSDIAGIIEGIVLEEMLHMTLVCNIINALGGAPAINDPAFIPQYPKPLPGAVEHDLTVHLLPYSTEQLDAFLTIEEPEHPLHFPSQLADAAQPPLTIGLYYAELKKQILGLDPSEFKKPPRNQIGPDLVDYAVPVKDAQTAIDAINLIVEQGEGTNLSPGEGVGGGFAHFYRFYQIKMGGTLKPNPNAAPDSPPDQKYIYGEPKIKFEPSGVFLAAHDPKAATYPPGTPERSAMDAFNQAYTDLLNLLHQTFNGNPNQLSPAIDAMHTLPDKAQKLMKMPAPGGRNLGPSFEFYVSSTK